MALKSFDIATRMGATFTIVAVDMPDPPHDLTPLYCWNHASGEESTEGFETLAQAAEDAVTTLAPLAKGKTK